MIAIKPPSSRDQIAAAWRFTYCLLLGVGLIASASAQPAPSAIAQRDALATEIVEAWKSFEPSVASRQLDPAERIRLIDEWRVAQKAKFDALAAAEKEIARSAATAPSPAPPPPLPTNLEPEMVRMIEIDREIAAGLEALRATAATPEQRIQAIDEFRAANQAKLNERRQLQRQLMARLAGTSNPVPQPAPPSDPREARILQLNQEIRGIIDAANQLAPEARIAAIDAAQEQLNQKHAEIRRLRQEQQAAPSSP